MPSARNKSRFRQWVARWRSGVRHQVTWSGLAFTALLLLTGFSAFASGNNLLFLLLAAMLSTMLVSGFLSRLSLAGIEVKLLLPEHVFARRTMPARLELYNSKLWMPAFSLHLASLDEEESPLQLYFPIVPGRSMLEAHTTVRFERRGLHGDSDYQFTTRFPFGFTERRLQMRLRREVLVYPSIDPQPGWEDILFALEGSLDAYLRGRGSDFYRIRPYVNGESVRHVDWKATAHTGDLQVREFAREEDHLVEICLDLRLGNAGSKWFEEAVEGVAFLCWRLAARQTRLRLVTQDFEASLPGAGDVYALLRYLAQVTPVRSDRLIYPHASGSFQIVFSANADSLLDAGWQAARVVSPTAGADASGSTAGRRQTASGADQRHRSG